MWDRVNGFIEELNFPHKCGKDDYIPESLFYLLGMKANNKVAYDVSKMLSTVDVDEKLVRKFFVLGQKITSIAKSMREFSFLCFFIFLNKIQCKNISPLCKNISYVVIE